MERHTLIEQRENEVRAAGQRAFDEGKTIEECPYRRHSREAELWRRGFANANFGVQMQQRA